MLNQASFFVAGGPKMIKGQMSKTSINYLNAPEMVILSKKGAGT